MLIPKSSMAGSCQSEIRYLVKVSGKKRTGAFLDILIHQIILHRKKYQPRGVLTAKAFH